MKTVGDQLDPNGKDPFKEVFSKRLDRARSAFDSWRERCRTWFRLYAGDAWDPEDRANMLAEKRQPVTFNYALSTINALIGSDQADRKEARFYGVAGDTPSEVIGEWFSELVRHVWRNSKGHRHESQAQLDQLITGYGWCEEFVDSSRFPFRIRPQYVPCLLMHIDPDYHEDNCSDARYLIAETRWAKEDAIARWPEKEHEIELLDATSGADRLHPYSVRGRNYQTVPTDNYLGPGDERVTLYDYQFKKREKWVAFADPTSGETKELPQDEYNKWMRQTFQQAGIDPTTGEPMVPQIDHIKFAREVIMRAFLAGDAKGGVIVLEEPKRIEQDMFTYRCATGYREVDQDTGQTRHFGLMALVEEPQRWSAKVLSTIVEMLARNGKGGGFIKKGALVDEKKFLTDGSKIGEWTLVEDGTEVGKDILERNPFQWPAAMDRMLDLAVNAIPEVSTVTNWIKGTAQTERSNVLISNLQGQSMVVLGPLMDPLAQFRVELGTLAARLIQVAMSDEEINKVLGEQEVEDLTHEAVIDPQTGEPITDPMTGENQLQPIMVDEQGNRLPPQPPPAPPPEPGQPPGAAPDGTEQPPPPMPQGRPITPADIIRKQDVLDFHVAVDLGDASTTAKQALWQVWNETGLLKTVMEIPNFPVDKMFPFLVRNTPGVPAEAAKRLADEIEEDMKQQKQMQSFQGLQQALQGLPPDQLQQLMQQFAPPPPPEQPQNGNGQAPPPDQQQQPPPQEPSQAPQPAPPQQ